MLPQKYVQIRSMIVSVRVGRVRRIEVVRHPRQSRALRCQIEQSNFSAIRLANGPSRQELADRLIECDLSLRNHLREDQTRKGLCDRSDLEDRICLRGSVCKHPFYSMIYNSDHDTRVRSRCKSATLQSLRQVAIEYRLQI